MIGILNYVGFLPGNSGLHIIKYLEQWTHKYKQWIIAGSMNSYWKAMKSHCLLLKYSLHMLLIECLYDNRAARLAERSRALNLDSNLAEGKSHLELFSSGNSQK